MLVFSVGSVYSKKKAHEKVHLDMQAKIFQRKNTGNLVASTVLFVALTIKMLGEILHDN